MTATNHALTGAITGLLVGEPILAIPIAFLSHYVCDAIPHYKSSLSDSKLLKSRGFRNYLIVDAALCFLIVLVLAIFQPENWLLASVCAFVATSPDLAWIPRYVRVRRGKKWRPSLYDKFAGNIQWFQRPIGGVVEAAWFVVAIVLISPFLA
jgi:hypothetical protein